ncbi:MAG: mechanosensitive ion channel, partial [Caldilineaceae bacterium]|nr:mechanosensitive ion channel [Caldilineaceae bacterium]
MSEQPGNQVIFDLLDTLLLLIFRPVVQRQLLAFGIVVLLAWLLPILFDRALQRLSRGKLDAKLRSRSDSGVWWRRLLRAANAAEYTFFPILGLLLGNLAIGIFRSQGWLYGLIEQLLPLFWLLLAYRLLVALLHTVFDDGAARTYQSRYLGPSFLILVIVNVYLGFAGTIRFAEVELFQMLETPITLRSVFVALVVLYAFFAAAWILRDVLNHYFGSHPETDVGVANTVNIVSYYTIIGAGILVSLNIVGFQLSALLIVFGGLSVGIGFGLQELVANFISGIMLLFEQSLRPGDIIEVSGQRGMVSKL